MNKISRRRSLLELLVCVMLVAGLAGQPALGDEDGAMIAMAAGATAADPVLTEPAPAPPAAPVPPPPPAGTPAPPPPTGPVEPTASAPEEGAGATAPSAPVPAATPAPGEQSTAYGPAPSEAAARPPASGGGSRVATPGDSQPEAVQPARAPAGTPAAGQVAPSGGPAASASTFGTSPTSARGGDAAPETGAGAGGAGSRRSDRSSLNLKTGTAGETSAQARLPGGPAIPPDAIAEPLNTPASEAITRNRVRSSSGFESSQPANGAEDVPRLGKPSPSSDDLVPTVIRAVTPAAKIALVVLGVLVLLLGAHALVATSRTRRLQHQRERLMEDIGLLQAALLPAVPSRLGALLTTVAYRPADGPAAGGDFYDAFALPDGRVGLLLGDVSGHGRQALAKTTLVRFTIRAHLEAGLSPREALAISGRSLDGRLSDDFATVIAAIHDPVQGTLTYASAGHPPPIVIGPSAHKPVTASSAPPIGAGFPTGQRQTVLPMPEGTTVIVYSDGLVEARVGGKLLGPDLLATWLTQLGPEATAAALLDLVVQRADRLGDDLAAVVLHAAPGASAPAARIEQLKLDVLDIDGPDLDGFLEAAGVSPADRAITGRRVSEQLAITGGVVVEVRTGEHPMVSVAPIGDETAITPRASMRARVVTDH